MSAKELMLLNCGVREDSWWRSNWQILMEISPEYSLEGLMLKLKLQYFRHLMRSADSFEKTLMLGKVEGRRRRWRQRMKWLDDITDLMDMIFSKLLEWWWTGMPGLLQSMGHYESDSLSDWTELNWLLNSKACCEDCFPQEWLHWDKNLTCSQLTHCPGMKHSNWQCWCKHKFEEFWGCWKW